MHEHKTSEFHNFKKQKSDLYCKLTNGIVMRYDIQSDTNKLPKEYKNRSNYVYIGEGVTYSCNGFIGIGITQRHFWIEKYKDTHLNEIK